MVRNQLAGPNKCDAAPDRSGAKFTWAGRMCGTWVGNGVGNGVITLAWVFSLWVMAAMLPGSIGIARAEDSIRCGSKLVSVEAKTGEVLAKCGEPSYRDSRSQMDPALGLPTEVWYYDRGPDQLVRAISVLDDQVVGIRSVGYGFAGPVEPAAVCQTRDFQEGISKYHLWRRCGEPLSHTVQNLFNQDINHGGFDANSHFGSRSRAGSAVYREIWIYNLGTAHFLYRITMENGIVVNVDTEDRRGY